MRKENLNRAMMASLACNFKDEKIANYSLDRNENLLEKYAGITIYQPTLENAEIFLRKYMLNELSFFPRALDLSIEIIPSSFDKVKKDYIEDATGVIKINMGKSSPEIPFMIRDGELFPFDIIQLNGERAPFTRDNLKKVICGVDHANQKNSNDVDNPFLGTEKVLNPSTSPGFLGDVLYIQDQHRGGSTSGRSQYVTASDEVDDLMEKLSTAKELTVHDINNIQKMFEKRAKDELLKEASILHNIDQKEKEGIFNEKIASDINTFLKAKNVSFLNSADISNATPVIFPEKEGNDLSVSNGIIFDKIKELNGNDFKAIKRMVIKSDASARILSDADHILCTKASNEKFKLHKTPIDFLKEGDVFIISSGDSVSCPYKVAYSINRRFHDRARRDVTIKGLYLIPVVKNENLDAVDNNSFGPTRPQETIVLFVENTAMLETDFDNALELISKNIGCSKDIAESMCGNIYVGRKGDSKILVTDPKTRIIKVKGAIKNAVKNKRELDLMESLASVDGADSMDKIAALGDQVRVECLDRRNKQYKISIRYTDREKRIFNQILKVFDRINEEKLRSILRILSFKPQTIQEIVYKSRNENSTQYPLPANADVSRLNGGMAQNLSKEKMVNTVGKFFSPNDLAGAIVTNAVSNMVVSSLKHNGGNVKKVGDFLKHFADKSAKQSGDFEKIAINCRNNDAKEVAKLMAISSMLFEKTASTITGDAVYPTIYDTAKDIINIKPHLEKTASDLIGLKVAQIVNRQEIIPCTYIQESINTLDTMYKVAKSINETNPLSSKKKQGE